MPISSGVIITEKQATTGLTMQSYGCSEFPAHDSAIIRYTTIGLAVSSDALVGQAMNAVMGKGYSTLKYLSDWVNFIVETFPSSISKDNKELFRPYTLGDYKLEESRITAAKLRHDKNGITGGPTGWGYTVHAQEALDESIIGLTTYCNNIRSICRGRHYSATGISQSGDSVCRKVQIGHTLFRLMWSSGWAIPLLTLKIKEVSDTNKLGLTNLNCLWMAYKIKWAVYQSYSDYGDIFNQHSGYVSEKCVVDRILEPKNNSSLMGIFVEEQNTLAAELGLDKVVVNDLSVISPLLNPGVKIGTNRDQVVAIINSIDTDTVTRMAAYVESCKSALAANYTKIKFKFSKTLFRSTATGVCYEGILKPNSKLNRVLFRDEENSTLSVLRESKFITEIQ